MKIEKKQIRNVHTVLWFAFSIQLFLTLFRILVDGCTFDFQVINHSLGQFDCDKFAHRVIKSDDILRCLRVLGSQCNDHVLIQILENTV